MGMTNASGQYELHYTNNVKGAAVGSHIVRIESLDDAEGQSTPVVVPSRYNVDSTLTAEVKAGENTINFDLTSKK